ncbi:unnamed protein product [Prorocentrum cordatum]|uniref:Uncharacterized protein n=2 Tax=Prorocentrum cordatum TaxID=2364126 RepID=A0ABN9XQX0_9DINO|nr:unnamed protein product [Polarella glacialis]
MEGTSPQRAREQLELLARGLERRPSHNNRPGSAARGAWTTSNSAAPVREAIPELDSMPGSSEARLRSKLAVLAGPDVPRRRATLEGGARPASAASLHRRVSAPPLAAAPALPPAAVAAPAPQLVMRAAPPLLAEGAGGDAETRLSPLPERAALRVSDDLRQQGRAPVPEAARASREASGLSLDGLGDEIRAVHAELRAVRVSVAELARAQAAAAAGGPSTLARVEEANRRLAEDFSAMSRQITQELSPVLEAGPQQAADLSLVLQGVRAQAGVLQEVRVRVCEEPPGALAGSASSDVAPVLEALRAQAGLLQEVLQSVADLSGFTKQLREGQASLDLSPVLEAVRAQAGVLKEVRQSLSENPAGASDSRDIREALAGLSDIVQQLREDKAAADLSQVLQEVRSVKQLQEGQPSVDLSPVLDAVRAQAGVLQEAYQRLSEKPADASNAPGIREAVEGVSEIVKQLRDGQAAVDLSPVLEEVRSLKQLREGQASLDLSPVLEAVRAQAGVLQEVQQSLSEKPAGALDAPDIREAVAGLSEILNQLREGQSAVDLSLVLEEVRSLKQLREGQPSLDLSPVLEAMQAQTGVIQEVRQRLSEKPAGASHEPDFREAFAGLSGIVKQLREDKAAVDLSPVLEEVRSLKQLRDGQAAVDLSPVLEEVRSLKQLREGQASLDLSPVLEAVRAQTGVLQEVQQSLSEKPAGAPDAPDIREAVAGLSEILNQLREGQSAVDLSLVLEEVRSLKQLREGQPSLDLSPVLEAMQAQTGVIQEVRQRLSEKPAQAGVLQEVRQRLSEKPAGASVEPEFREAVKIVKQGVSELVNQLREGKSAVDLSPVLEEVRSLKQLREGQSSLDLSPVLEAVQALAGSLQQVHQRLSEKPAGASVEPEFREAVKIVKQGVSELVNQLREGKSAVDLSPVLEEVRSLMQLREDTWAVDLSSALEEVRSLKQSREGQPCLDVTPVMEAVQSQAGVLHEVHRWLSERQAGASVEPEFREAVKLVKQGLSEIVNQLREGQSAVDLTPVLEEVRSLKQLREGQSSLDLSPVLEAVQALAGSLQQVHQRLSEKSAGASVEPEFREAVKIVKQGVSELVNQLREGKSAVDLSPVLEEVRSLMQLREDKWAVDLSSALEEVRSLKQSREGQPCLEVSPVMEAVQSQAGVLHEVHRWLSERQAGASVEPEFREAVKLVKQGLSEIVNQLREGQSAVDLTPVLEEVRSLKQLREGQSSLDLSPVLEAVQAQAGVLQEVRQRLSEKPAGASVEPEFREAVKIVKQGVSELVNQLREGKSAVDLSPVLEEVRSLKQLRESQPSSDLSPVLEAMQAQASVLQQVYQRLSEKPAGASHEPTTREAVADLSEIVKQLRDSQSSVDMSQVLEEVRLLKQVRENQPTLDLSPVLETMQAQAGVLREIHKRLTEKPSGLSDERMIPEAAADLSEVPEPLADSKESSRRSPIATTVDLSPILAAMRVQADGLQQVQSKVRDLIIIIIAHVANIINTISIINNNMIVNLTNISFIIINTSIGINDPR